MYFAKLNVAFINETQEAVEKKSNTPVNRAVMRVNTNVRETLKKLSEVYVPELLPTKPVHHS